MSEASHSHPGREVFLVEREMKSLVPTCGLPHVVSISMPPSWTEWKGRGPESNVQLHFHEVTVMEELIKCFGL